MSSVASRALPVIPVVVLLGLATTSEVAGARGVALVAGLLIAVTLTSIMLRVPKRPRPVVATLAGSAVAAVTAALVTAWPGASLASGIQLGDHSLDLHGAVLVGAHLTGARLAGVDLSGADLSKADLRGADLRAACLRGANLTEADLRGARLDGADLSGAVTPSLLPKTRPAEGVCNR